MRLKLFLLSFVMTACVAPLDVVEEDAPKLLGRCTAQQLDEEPYSEWSRKEYEGYAPNPAILDTLNGIDTAGLEFKLFLGTWCGDSRREVPRMLKLFDSMGIPEERVHLIALDRADDAVKQSPDHEERGREIYRVPTLIVERDGTEIARLVEHPVRSLERDMVAMLAGPGYTPSYAAYPLVRDWLADGLLSDPNVSPWGLAGQVRPLINGAGDLAAAARVMQSRGDLAEAIKLFEVNCALDWQNSWNHQRLAEALLESGDLEKAHESAERALRFNEDDERLDELTTLLEQTGADEARSS